MIASLACPCFFSCFWDSHSICVHIHQHRSQYNLRTGWEKMSIIWLLQECRYRSSLFNPFTIDYKDFFQTCAMYTKSVGVRPSTQKILISTKYSIWNNFKDFKQTVKQSEINNPYNLKYGAHWIVAIWFKVSVDGQAPKNAVENTNLISEPFSLGNLTVRIANLNPVFFKHFVFLKLLKAEQNILL